MDDCDDIVKEFLIESHENLDRLDRDLVELEKHPSDQRDSGEHFPHDPHDQGDVPAFLASANWRQSLT